MGDLTRPSTARADEHAEGHSGTVYSGAKAARARRSSIRPWGSSLAILTAGGSRSPTIDAITAQVSKVAM